MAIKRKKTSQVSRKTKKSGKIWLIAMDPFSDLDWRPLEKMIAPLAAQSNAKVRAVYVMAPTSFNWTGDFSGPWVKKYLPLSEAKMKEVLGEDFQWDVVPCKESGLRHAVKALVNHARKVKAECIVISTHARSGLSRLAMGSFAETLILSSKIPVLVINPDQQLSPQVRKILVPTDLSKGSERFIKAVAQNAKAWGAKMILYYKQPDLLDPIIQQGVYSLGGGWVTTQTFVDDELKRKTKQIERLEKSISEMGVPVSHVMDASPIGLIDSIEQTAKDQGADMVSVLTHADSWTSQLLGSVARGLVRRSSVPVLIER